MNEIFKDIKNFEGLYKISNYGRVKSLPKKISYKDGRVYYYPERFLKAGRDGGGYFHVILVKQKRKFLFKIHRLVVIHFLEKINNKLYVNHKDGVKTNNHVSNLEWCTPSENNKHAYQLGLKKNINHKGERNPAHKLNKNQVQEIKNFLNLQPKISQQKIAKLYKVSQTTISFIKLNKSWNE